MKLQGKGWTALTLCLAVIWLIPFAWMTATAFTEPTLKMSIFPTTAFTLRNFSDVFQMVPLGRYFLNTILIVVCTFTLQFLMITMGGYALARGRFAGEKIVMAVVMMQIIIPNDVLIVPNYLTISRLGLIDTKLAVMLPFLGSAMGLFLLRQQFKSMPYALTEAAIIDGASTMRVIWQIYVPNAKTAYLAFGMVSVSYHWNNFLWPLIVTNSVENRPLTVGLAVFSRSTETALLWGDICACAFAISIPLVLAFFLFQKQFINSFVSAGIK